MQRKNHEQKSHVDRGKRRSLAMLNRNRKVTMKICQKQIVWKGNDTDLAGLMPNRSRIHPIERCRPCSSGNRKNLDKIRFKERKSFVHLKEKSLCWQSICKNV